MHLYVICVWCMCMCFMYVACVLYLCGMYICCACIVCVLICYVCVCMHVYVYVEPEDNLWHSSTSTMYHFFGNRVSTALELTVSAV